MMRFGGFEQLTFRGIRARDAGIASAACSKQVGNKT
jgi:hypothetical protein